MHYYATVSASNFQFPICSGLRASTLGSFILFLAGPVRSVAYKSNYNGSDLKLCLQSLALDHSEARNDQGRRVKQKFKKSVMNGSVLNRVRLCFFAYCEKGPFLNLKKSFKIKGLRHRYTQKTQQHCGCRMYIV